MSRKRSFRRRWPVYLAMTLICVTSVAIVILIMGDIATPPSTKASQKSTVPKAIR